MAVETRERTRQFVASSSTSKYDISRGGWDYDGPTCRFSGVWKGIMSIKDILEANVNFWIGGGRLLLFWSNIWVGNSPFAT